VSQCREAAAAVQGIAQTSATIERWQGANLSRIFRREKTLEATIINKLIK
jgi:hypothetical protein